MTGFFDRIKAKFLSFWTKKKKYPDENATDGEKEPLIPPNGSSGAPSTAHDPHLASSQDDDDYYYPDPDPDNPSHDSQHHHGPDYTTHPVAPLRPRLDLPTPNEQEHEIQDIRRKIRGTNQQAVLSTEQTLALAEKAEETGRKNLKRLDSQRRRLANADKLLRTADGKADQSIAKTEELKKLKSKPFFCCVSTTSDDDVDVEKEANEKVQQQLEAADKRRREANETKEIDKDLEKQIQERPQRTDKEVEKSKFVYEPDPPDVAIERKIEDNLDKLLIATEHLKRIAKNTSQELDEQAQYAKNLKGKVCLRCV
jgi:hypothetical protein